MKKNCLQRLHKWLVKLFCHENIYIKIRTDIYVQATQKKIIQTSNKQTNKHVK